MIPKRNIEMELEFSPEFRKKYRNVDVRIRHRVDDYLRIFRNNPKDLELDNHALKRGWKGYCSIDINADYRAIYKETKIGDDFVAYFVALGTHKELYQK